MKKFRYVLCLAFVLCILDIHAQNFNYKTVPGSYLQSPTKLTNFVGQMQSQLPNAYPLEKLLPRGYVRDGSVDYTDYLQQGLDNNNVVLFPDFPVMVNKKGLAVKSNATVIFNVNSKLILANTDSKYYDILHLTDAQNVTLYFPTIIGDRNGHMGVGGEWGMGLAIRGCSNITVVNPKISNCWGDGIYVGRSKNAVSNNIKIYSAQLDFNRRNGISITSVNNLLLEGATISNTAGTNPQSGLDIEPNTNNDVIDNIELDNVVTYNNAVNGIILSLDRLAGVNPENVHIEIRNHRDFESMYGLAVNLDSNVPRAHVPLEGNIEITGGDWRNNKRKNIIFYHVLDDNLNVRINDNQLTRGNVKSFPGVH